MQVLSTSQGKNQQGDRFKCRTVHIGLGELYAVGHAGGAATGKARHLYRIDVTDLRPGDTVLILGTDEGNDSLSGLGFDRGFLACWHTPA
jgi:hypothetical protein